MSHQALRVHDIEQGMNRDVERTIHLSDLSFSQYCNEAFGVNRGVYNTIDVWLFNEGMENILERRRHILRFLTFINEQQVDKEKCCKKFGKGGLKIKLEEYLFGTQKNIVSKAASNY